MNKATLKQTITETRKDLILSLVDYNLDISDSRSITLWNNDSNELADSVDSMCNCNVSMTEWYQENFSEISNEELIEELEKRFDGKIEVLRQFNKTIINF